MGDESDTARRFIYNEDPVAESLWNRQRTLLKDGMKMIYSGIDVAKNKHDCCIVNSSGEVVVESFSFDNNRDGFNKLLCAIKQAAQKEQTQEIRAGLEATGHYSANLVAFLRNSGVELVVLNPLQVNLFRKSHTLRKTKTDKIDAKCIAKMLITADANPVCLSYQIQELKSLTRHRSRVVSQQSKCKQSLSRLVDILFPELPTVCCSITQASIVALLLELPGAHAISECRIDRLCRILQKASKGRYSLDKAKEIKDLACQSIAISSPATSIELRFTLQHLLFLQDQIRELDQSIRICTQQTQTPLLTIPGISYTLAGVILAEIGDIHRFDSPDQLQAFAGLEPSTYQSGNFQANRTSMVKHGSTYLRWALIQAARLVSQNCETFHNYLQNKRAQGKHYFVALSHTSKKLIRVIFHILISNEAFDPQA